MFRPQEFHFEGTEGNRYNLWWSWDHWSWAQPPGYIPIWSKIISQCLTDDLDIKNNMFDLGKLVVRLSTRSYFASSADKARIKQINASMKLSLNVPWLSFWWTVSSECRSGPLVSFPVNPNFDPRQMCDEVFRYRGPDLEPWKRDEATLNKIKTYWLYGPFQIWPEADEIMHPFIGWTYHILFIHSQLTKSCMTNSCTSRCNYGIVMGPTTYLLVQDFVHPEHEGLRRSCIEMIWRIP